MSLFAASPVYCPSCGVLYPAIISGSSGLASVAGCGIPICEITMFMFTIQRQHVGCPKCLRVVKREVKYGHGR